MTRLLAIAVFLLAALGCAPAIVQLPKPPAVSVLRDLGPTVSVAWPVDLRNASSRRDGQNYSAFSPVGVPLPHHLYGDNNLRPSPLAALNDNLGAALRLRGVPLVDHNADFRVKVYVLEHKGVRDVSDAQWVSTLTGGTAGTVGAFFYPLFTVTSAHVRIEVRDREGTLVAVRGVKHDVVRRKPKALTWGIWSLYLRSPQTEMFESAFQELYTVVTSQTAAAIDEARRGVPQVAGIAPSVPLEHALRDEWGRLDSIDFRGNDGRAGSDSLAALKYGSRRFSVVTGHDTVKGDTIGRFTLPLDNFGYDVGLKRRLQLEIDITVLGLYNSFGSGLRYELWRRAHRRLAVQGRIGGILAWEGESTSSKLVTGARADTSLIYSSRPKDITWYVRAGAGGVLLGEGLEQYDVGDGRIVNLIAEPGLEYQLTPTMAIAFGLSFRATYQQGTPLNLYDLPSFVPVPMISLGLR